jgi:hypothetical protein
VFVLGKLLPEHFLPVSEAAFRKQQGPNQPGGNSS